MRTKDQQRASRENFSISLLRAWRVIVNDFMRPVLDAQIRNQLTFTIDVSIGHIKAKQGIRQAKRRN